ncbi:DUF2147 domain-containing protein [Cetobacterium sp. SF1]|uniref:DUF2147 domain-containing protein n=1 Tax=unclassified Cetobacterium TaxID=2630983 RepID=UPI003CF11349
MIKKVIIALIFIKGIISFSAEGDICGFWITQEEKNPYEAVIEIRNINEKYFGNIICVTYEKNGKLYGSKNDEIIDFSILKNLNYNKNKDFYENGIIINPKNGKKYNASIKIENNKNQMKLRGSLDSFGILGANRIWKRIKLEDIKYVENLKEIENE